MLILQLHLGLIRYLLKEIPKKRTPKQFVLFLKEIIKAYLKELLKLYKQVFLYFDPMYRKQKSNFKKHQQIKVDLQRALKLLQHIDKKISAKGVKRIERRRFWREFFKDGMVRTEVFDQLVNEIK